MHGGYAGNIGCGVGIVKLDLGCASNPRGTQKNTVNAVTSLPRQGQRILAGRWSVSGTTGLHSECFTRPEGTQDVNFDSCQAYVPRPARAQFPLPDPTGGSAVAPPTG